MFSNKVVATALIILGTLAGQMIMAQSIDLPDSPAYHVNIPAGPFSTVNTMSGTLNTTIPILSLKGRGRTNLSFAITHLSRQVALDNSKRQVARGWHHNYNEYFRNTSVYNGFYDNYDDTYTRASVNGRFGIWLAGNKNRIIDTLDTLSVSSNRYTVTERGTGTKYIFGPDSDTGGGRNLGRIQDIFGNAISLNYDSSRLQTISDNANRVLRLLYRANTSTYGISNVVLSWKPEGTETTKTRQWTFGLDESSGAANGRLKSVTNPLGETVSFTYDSTNNIETVTDARGYVWKYEYLTGVDVGRIKSVMPPGGVPGVIGTNKIILSYPRGSGDLKQISVQGAPGDDSIEWSGWPTKVTDLKGRTTTYYYAREDRYISAENTAVFRPLLQVVDPKVTGDASAATEKMFFDQGTGHLRRKVDRRGIATVYTWDENEDELDKTTTYDTLDPGGTARYTTEYLYAGNHLPTSKKEKYKLGSATEITIGQTTVNYADASGTLPSETTVWKSVGGVLQPAVVTHCSYDVFGRLYLTWKGGDAGLHFSDFSVYDDQAQTITSPSNGESVIDYDALGTKVSETAPSTNGTPRTTWYKYDEGDRLTLTTFPDGATTARTYFPGGLVYRDTGRNGGVTEYSYDCLGRCTLSKVDVSPTASGGLNRLTTSYTYDLNGNLTDVRSFNYNGTPQEGSIPVKSILYQYDERNRRIRTYMADDTSEKAHYDAGGNVDVSTDASGNVTSYVYDGLNRLRQRSVSGGEYATITYAPNTAGAVTTSILTPAVGPAVRTVETTNLAGQLVSSYQSTPDVTLEYEYDDAGRRSSLRVGSQRWTYFYDKTRLDRIEQAIGAKVAARYEYNPDDSIRVARAPEAGLRTEYGYDAYGRATSLVTSATDANGNPQRTLQTILHYRGTEGETLRYVDIADDGKVYYSDYEYDLTQRLVTEVANADVGSGYALLFRNGYTYDCLGNRASVYHTDSSGISTTATLAYDANDKFRSGLGYAVPSYDLNGRPRSLTYPDGSSATLSYGAYGKEDQVTAIGAHGGSPAVGYAYDAAGRRVAQTGGPPGAAKVFAFDGDDAVLERFGDAYTYRLPGVGYVEDGVQRYERLNAQGSVTATYDAAGVRLSRAYYDAWGGYAMLQPGARGRYAYGASSGYAEDGASGMILCGARLYVPGLGRFLTPDPIGHEGGLNLYAYCDNNPVNAVDPDGTQGLLTDAANFFGGMGSSMTFGGTGALSQWINRKLGYDEFQYGGGLFVTGQVAGGLESFMLGGGLNGLKALTSVRNFAGSAEAVSNSLTAYRSVNTAGDVVYVGITKDILRRGAEHAAANRFPQIGQIPGLGNMTRFEARAVEQVLINYHGLGKNGGSLLNKINSISKYNPNYARALRIGRSLLRKAGYPGIK